MPDFKPKPENWFYCELCQTVSYRHDCCGHVSCSGRGCDVCCQGREVSDGPSEVIERMIRGGKAPDKSTIPHMGNGMKKLLREAAEAATKPDDRPPIHTEWTGMKIPTFFLDADDDMGNRAIGAATDLAVTIANLTAEFREALDRLERGSDGDVVTLRLSRRDMTPEELAAAEE